MKNVVYICIYLFSDNLSRKDHVQYIYIYIYYTESKEQRALLIVYMFDGTDSYGCHFAAVEW